MKKLLLSAMLAAMAIPASAFFAENSTSQLSMILPAAGAVNFDYDNQGIKSCLFNFRISPAEPNRNANVFATLYKGNDPLLMVPASNTSAISYDNFMDHVWQLVFPTASSVKIWEPGEYTLVFDEGFFLLGENKEPSEQVVVNYIVNPVPMTTTPAEGNVSMLEEITVHFNGEGKLQYDPSMKVEVFDLFGKGDEVQYFYPEVELNGNDATLYFTPVITIPGTWKVCASDGAFSYLLDDGSTTNVTNFNLQFVIENFLNGKPTIYPAEGEVASFPGVFTLTIPEGAKVGTVNNMCSIYLYPENEDGSLGESIARFSGKKNPDNDREIFLTNIKGADNDITAAPGNYVLKISDKLYRIDSDSKYISPLEYHFSVASPVVNYTVTPADGVVSELDQITFTFPDATSVELISGNAAQVRNSLISYQFWPGGVDGKSITYNTQVPVTVEGDYSFVCPTSSLKVDGKIISVSAAFKVGKKSGINVVESKLPEVFNIYSIDGCVVKQNANANDFNALPAGLYIAAGQKILIK